MASVGAVVPWTWWLVRDRGWPLDIVATAIPALALLVLIASMVVVGVGVWLPSPARATVRASGLALAVSTIAAATLGVLGPWAPRTTCAPRPDRAVRLAAYNIRFDNPEPAAVVAAVAASGADVVVLSEATGVTAAGISSLYPYTASSRSKGSYFQLVASRYPLRELDTQSTVGQDVVRVEVGAPERFVLYGAHLARPGLGTAELGGRVRFTDHRAEVARLDDAARAEQLPVVIAGDLNLSDRAWGYRHLTDGRVDAMRSSWAGPTFPGRPFWRLLLLRIDHIVIDGRWCAAGGERRELPGSDHLGVVARVGPCSTES